MADSQKLTVLKRLTLLLEGTELTPYDGLNPPLPTTLANVVTRGRGKFADSDPKTMLSILEAPRPANAIYTADGQARVEDWVLLIQGWCPEDGKHPSDPIYGLMSNVEARLDRITRANRTDGAPKYPEHYMLGTYGDDGKPIITKFQMSPGVVRPPTEGISSRCYFYLPVQVGLARISA